MPIINAELVRKVLREVEETIDGGKTDRGWMEAIAKRHGLSRQALLGWIRKYKDSSRVPDNLESKEIKSPRLDKPSRAKTDEKAVFQPIMESADLARLKKENNDLRLAIAALYLQLRTVKSSVQEFING